MSTADTALEIAVRALAHRDRTAAELDDRLESAGFDRSTRDETLRRLRAAGYLDDGRAALERAHVMARRGASDAAIRHDLAKRGLATQVVEGALIALEPEAERARQAARKLGGGPRAARALARKGFAREAIEAAVETGVADDP